MRWAIGSVHFVGDGNMKLKNLHEAATATNVDVTLGLRMLGTQTADLNTIQYYLAPMYGASYVIKNVGTPTVSARETPPNALRTNHIKAKNIIEQAVKSAGWMIVKINARSLGYKPDAVNVYLNALPIQAPTTGLHDNDEWGSDGGISFEFTFDFKENKIIYPGWWRRDDPKSSWVSLSDPGLMLKLIETIKSRTQ